MPLLLKVTSPLGEDVLIATHFRVSEQLGLPYSIELEVLADSPSLTASDLLTLPVALTVTQSPDGVPLMRHFHGLVAEFACLGPGASGYTVYRLVLVPGIWKLGLRQNCRIFQDKTVKEIITAVLSDHGEPTPQWGILPELQPIAYCTQFNETDLQFVSRLMEEFGLTFYFTHTASSHTLCISATANGFPVFEGGEVGAVQNTPGYFELGDWRRANRARSAKTLFNDMDGERSQPSVVLNKTSATRTYPEEPAMWAGGEVFHWPGGMSTRPGLDNAAVAMGEQETASEEFEATALDPRFIAGARMPVGVVGLDGARVTKQYVITSVKHEGSETASLAAGAGGTETYGAAVKLVAASRTWMPKPRHTRPVMAGLYSARITGPEGEKIHVDEFGRVKVRFRWDRAGSGTDTSSCWIRVAQAAAGAWGGTWFLPRVGDEVLVAFLDGDPDRPVVTGSVYGKDAKPPFLPGANRAQSGIRTRSYKSDSADDANIFRFEDKKGSEEVLLHAQKDLKVEVENDETRTVDHDQIETIKNSRTTVIKDADDTLTHEKGNRSTTIKMGNDTLKIEQGNETHTIQMGDMTVKCEMGSITLEAMQKITLKVGATTSIELTPSGITLKGMTITSEATGPHQIKGAIVKVDAQGPVMVNGAMVMLN